MLAIFFTIVLTCLFSVARSTSVSPRQASISQQYYLITSIVNSTSDTGTYKGDLFVTSYHTGAGLSDVTLTPNISDAVSGYLNTTADSNGSTTWITNLTSVPAGNETLYWGMCGSETPYGSKLFPKAHASVQQLTAADWDTMTIDLGQDTCDAFYADSDLLVFGNYTGWLACDWWHEVPQLFLITSGQADDQPFSPPTSCSVVDLQMQAVDEDDDLC